MAADEPSGPRPAPVVLRIKLRYDDVESMVQRFAPNVGKSGLFLPTKSLQPVGAEVKFELRIADDTAVLVGLGRVKAARAPDPAAPRAAFGMAIELMRVTRESREVILRMLERRKQLSLPDVGIPMPADIDAARRAEVIDTQVKGAASTAVPAPAQILDSGGSEALLTSPRRASGPIAVAKLNVVEALAPEPMRRKRPAVHEVIESASGPIISVVSVPGLDDDVDVGAVLARARVLAGGNLDAELEALREIAAAPLEISIEAASAELARQLGGAAVNKRDRSARWAPPPSTVSAPVSVPEIAAKGEPPAPAPEPIVSTAAASEPAAPPEPELASISATVTTSGSISLDTAPSAPAVAPTFVDEEDSGPVHMAPRTAADIITDPATPLIHDDVDPGAFEAREHPAHEVEPEQIADEVHQLADEDYEEVEHTVIGAMPVAPTFDEQGAFVTEPAATAELERSLDAHLAEAEAEAEADDLGISGAYAMPVASSEAPAEEVPQEEAAADELEEVDDFEILAEADAEDEDLLASHGEADVSGSREIDLAAAPPPRAREPEPRPSHSDFVSRLDLSDEFEAAPEPDPPEERLLAGRHASFSELDARLGELDPQSTSAGQALAGFDEPEPEAHSEFDEPVGYASGPTGNPDDLDADSQYTIAAALPPADFDAPQTGFAGHRAYDAVDEVLAGLSSPHAFDESDVEQPVAQQRRGRQPSEPYELRSPPVQQPAPGDDGYDLETALEALDVDLDDLSVPHERPSGLEPPASQGRAQRAPVARPPSQQRAASRTSGSVKIPKRASTDDGVLIEFEDDE